MSVSPCGTAQHAGEFVRRRVESACRAYHGPIGLAGQAAVGVTYQGIQGSFPNFTQMILGLLHGTLFPEFLAGAGGTSGASGRKFRKEEGSLRSNPGPRGASGPSKLITGPRGASVYASQVQAARASPASRASGDSRSRRSPPADSIVVSPAPNWRSVARDGPPDFPYFTHVVTALAGLEALPTVIATGTAVAERAPEGIVICAIPRDGGVSRFR